MFNQVSSPRKRSSLERATSKAHQNIEKTVKNPMIFRKHDPFHAVHDNMYVATQIEDGFTLAGGGQPKMLVMDQMKKENRHTKDPFVLGKGYSVRESSIALT